jgi:type III pantothenate kinase
VGADRLVGAFAAKVLYGEPLIIIDFGTAVTIDVVGSRGAYEGGIIVPGIRLSAQSLFKKTALLPNIASFKPPAALIGRDTRESILSGLFYGYGALCDGLIERISAQMGRRPKVIVTGGHTRAMTKMISRKVHHIDKQLVIKGIYLTYKAS